MNDPVEKETVEQFAKRIKTKYPEYADKDDYDLAERAVRKDPVYLDKVQMPANFKLRRATSGYPKLDDLYEEIGRANNVNPDLLIEQARQETSFNPDVFYGRRGSSAGAKGSGQFMPGTATRFQVDVNNPRSGMEGQAKYMRKLLDMFDGDEDLALAGYNAGEGAVEKYGRKVPPYKETQHYVKTIREKLGKLTSEPLQRTAFTAPPSNAPLSPSGKRMMLPTDKLAADAQLPPVNPQAYR